MRKKFLLGIFIIFICVFIFGDICFADTGESESKINFQKVIIASIATLATLGLLFAKPSGLRIQKSRSLSNQRPVL